MLGFVYKLCSKDPSIEEIYVGSTINITDRMKSHKSNSNNANNRKYNYKVYKFIRDNGGWTDWTYDILEECDVESKEELELCYEDTWIINLEPQLNSQRARRTPKEYREENKEKITIKNKEYYQQNREQLIKRKKKYREENKEQISIKANEKFNCECGGRYTRAHKSVHEKSKKHLDFINNKKN